MYIYIVAYSLLLHSFDFDRVFAETAGDDEVYRGAVEPLVQAAAAGCFATAIM